MRRALQSDTEVIDKWGWLLLQQRHKTHSLH